MDEIVEPEVLDSLYLEVTINNDTFTLPLHSTITLFLLNYCQASCFRIVMSTKSGDQWSWLGDLHSTLLAEKTQERASNLVRACKMPAVLDANGTFCRAGLAVVLRYIVHQTNIGKPSELNIESLLGFKKTCLKACAEVSNWTRLCELEIPLAVEEHLGKPANEASSIPAAILLLENKLGEPVKVHNDDKLRRQKLLQQTADPGPGQSTLNVTAEIQGDSVPDCNVEIGAALAKLVVDEISDVQTKKPPSIRRVKTENLPDLEHSFAEGLYFTLTDIVLIPCIHQYMSSLQRLAPQALSRLPLLMRWYRRVQEVPGVRRAAESLGMVLFTPQPSERLLAQVSTESAPECQNTEPNKETFIGGPRPTLTKLKEKGVDAVFSSHPNPTWAVPWEEFPPAVHPTTGKLSDHRAMRKCQQLNNLVAMATALAHPGDTVVDFCSGGGHAGIVLAYMLPECQVLLVENKEESLMRAKQRSALLNLKNIGFIQTNLDYFIGLFHIGVALHACGVATDMVLERCVQAGASFVISPCCYGFIQNTKKFSFPRSQQISKILDYKEHMILCRFADQTAVQLPEERRLTGKRCMGLVDLDRRWAAEAQGYSVQVITMEPASCSPKNNLLIGQPGQKADLTL